ncbi:MAG: hypothetical protein QOH50_4385 [Kribbellaceae bacterium]|jgi:hypothetical protein|nr:hypothetical protein [Kribbellaceae bacterium]
MPAMQVTDEQIGAVRPQATRPAARLVPWLIPVVVAFLGLVSIDVPILDAGRYALYFAACVVLPGVLLMRALWRSTGNWAEDVGLGAVVGVTYQMAGWAVFTALGWQRWLLVWPLFVLVCFAAIPALRRHWRIAQPRPLPLAWTWGLVVAASVMVGGATLGAMAYHPPPPSGTAYYPDLLYHLSMLNELIRSVPPQLPQVAGEPLDYHWFANADMAGAVDITRLPAILVLYRLWLLPLVVVALLVCATLARTVSRTWWTGVLAAVALAGPQLGLLLVTRPDLAPPLSLISPSQTFGLIAGAAAGVFLIEVLFRGSKSKGLWVLAIAVGVVGGGSKPTILPILLGAVGLSAAYLLVRDRKLPWRSVVAGALLLIAAVGTMLSLAGSTSGSKIQFLAIVKLQSGYHAATGDRTPAGAGGWILPSLASGKLLTVFGALVIFGLLLMSQAAAAAGFGLLVGRTTRQDPVGWFLLGALVAGWAGYLLVDHPSASESYFVRSVAPFGLAAVGWLAAVAARGHRRREIGLVVSLAAVSGGLFALILLAARAGRIGPSDRVWAVARPLLGVGVLAALLIIAWWFLVRRSSAQGRWSALAGLGVVLTLVTILVVPTATETAQGIGLRVRGGHRASAFSSKLWRIYPDEVAAALWLGANSRPTDVVASNTYCRPAGSQRPGCDARGYIVSGIAGRRTLIEGWAYTNQAMANQGVGGLRYTRQPSPWPDRVALTNQAMAAPTRQLLHRLRYEYAVRWLYADQRDGPVSLALNTLATLRHTNGLIRIYSL